MTGFAFAHHVSQSPRPLPSSTPALFHMHSFAPKAINTKTVEIALDAHLLSPYDCFLLRVSRHAFAYRCLTLTQVPFENSTSGVLYAWIGRHADPENASTIQQLMQLPLWQACTMRPGYFAYGAQDFTLQVVYEGEEPRHFFWSTLDADATFYKAVDSISRARLFRCTNALGYFKVSPFPYGFCQDDLDEDHGCTVAACVGAQLLRQRSCWMSVTSCTCGLGPAPATPRSTLLSAAQT